jgi:hypothetical protein
MTNPFTDEKMNTFREILYLDSRMREMTEVLTKRIEQLKMRLETNERR